MSKFRKSKFLLKGCAFAVAPVVLSGSAPQSVNALFSIEDFKEWWKSFEDLIKKLFAGKSEKSNDSSEVVEQNKILSNSANENGIVKNLLGEKDKWEFDEKTGKYSTVYNLNCFGKVFVSVEPCSTTEGMYTVKLSVNKSKDYNSKDGEKEVIKKFNISSVKEADTVKEYLEKRVKHMQKFEKTLEEFGFRWKRSSARTSLLILPSNFELKLKSTEGKNYVVSKVEYDFVDSAFKVYSKDFESGETPFLVCNKEEEIDGLLENIFFGVRRLYTSIAIEAKKHFDRVLDGKNWERVPTTKRCSLTLFIEGFEVPLHIEACSIEDKDGNFGAGYRVGCFEEPYGNFFCSKNFGDDEKKKLTMAVEELTSFIKFFKVLEKTGKFGQAQFSKEAGGLKVESKEGINVGVCFQYSNEKDSKHLLLKEVNKQSEQCLLKKITYRPNWPGATVIFLVNGENKIFHLNFDNKDEKDAFYEFAKYLEHVVSNKNEVASKEQISGLVGQSNLPV